MEENDIIVRTLTLVIKFDEKYPPDWIWECHKNNSFKNGILIEAIAEGYKIRNSAEDDEEC